MNNLSNAVLSKIVKLSAADYKALTENKTRAKKEGGISFTVSKLKVGEAFHVSNIKSIPSQAYAAAIDNGFRVAVRAGMNHIGQAGYWIVRKHG